MRVICADRLCGKKCILGCLKDGDAFYCFVCDSDYCPLNCDVIEIKPLVCGGYHGS